MNRLQPYLLWAGLFCSTCLPAQVPPPAKSAADFHKGDLTFENHRLPENFSGQLNDEFAPAGSSHGRAKAGHIFLSLLLPGAGEWAAGHKGAAKIFLGSEAALWLGYWGTQSYINILQKDMESLAALRAGTHTAGKDEQFWVDVGSAASLQEFNERKLLERDLEGTYPDTPEFRWQWQSDEDRLQYVEKRFQRLDWKRRSNWVVGAIVLNHLVSAIDVIRLIRKDVRQAQSRRRSLMNVSYAQNAWDGEVYRMKFTVQW